MVKSNNKRIREIKAALMRKGLTQADIATGLGVSQQSVSLVIRGKSTSARIIQALVEAGVPENLLKDDAE